MCLQALNDTKARLTEVEAAGAALKGQLAQRHAEING
jgi:hypothetical protein